MKQSIVKNTPRVVARVARRVLTEEAAGWKRGQVPEHARVATCRGEEIKKRKKRCYKLFFFISRSCSPILVLSLRPSAPLVFLEVQQCKHRRYRRARASNDGHVCLLFSVRYRGPLARCSRGKCMGAGHPASI